MISLSSVEVALLFVNILLIIITHIVTMLFDLSINKKRPNPRHQLSMMTIFGLKIIGLLIFKDTKL